jgi:uncharacterized Zn ribbon protein
MEEELITPTIIESSIIKTCKKKVKMVIEEDDELETTTITFTENEKKHYEGPFSQHAKFKTPEEEYEYNKTKFKICNKCNCSLSLNDFGGNTSGKDPFDKHGYRLKRGDCISCNKGLSKGKNNAITVAKKVGMSYKAPPGTTCEICKKTDNIVFDHHHQKEVFRGWLCNGCNRSIGMLGEDIYKLVDCLNYLNKMDDKRLHFDEETKTLKII